MIFDWQFRASLISHLPSWMRFFGMFFALFRSGCPSRHAYAFINRAHDRNPCLSALRTSGKLVKIQQPPPCGWCGCDALFYGNMLWCWQNTMGLVVHGRWNRWEHGYRLLKLHLLCGLMVVSSCLSVWCRCRRCLVFISLRVMASIASSSCVSTLHYMLIGFSLQAILSCARDDKCTHLGHWCKKDKSFLLIWTQKHLGKLLEGELPYSKKKMNRIKEDDDCGLDQYELKTTHSHPNKYQGSGPMVRWNERFVGTCEK